MAIIYSYPSETNIQSSDFLVGTSTVTTNGVQENVTRSYTVGNLATYLNTIISAVTSIEFTAPLTGGTVTSIGTVGITQSSAVSDGYLSSVDWNAFNSSISSTGTQYSIPVWSQTNALGDSSLTEPIGNYIYANKHFSPFADDTWDLGTSTVSTRWKNIYSSATMYSANISISGYLNTATGNGTVGQILQSQGAGQPVRWVDDALGDITGVTTATPQQLTITTGTGPVPNLDIVTGTVITAGTALATGGEIVTYVAAQGYAGGTVTNVTSNTQNQLTVGTGTTTPALAIITGTVTGAGTALATGADIATYVTGLGYGSGTVTSVTSADANRITVAGAATDPTIDANTAAVGSASNNLATGAQIQTAIDTALTSALVYQGGYNAATNSPDLAGANNIAITKGWVYTVTVAGLFFTEAVEIGDTIIAEEDMAINGGSTLSKWTTVQNNIDIATATTVGIASFPTGTGALSITVGGAVTAQTYAGTSTTGYVPTSVIGDAGKFLKQDGTWDSGPAYGVSSITISPGLTGNTTPITATGNIAPDYTANANNLILAAPNTLTSPLDADSLLINDDSGGGLKDITVGSLKTYINAGVSGTVTSLGLATPAAFSVTSTTTNPITTSGTLTIGVTGGASGQYLDTTGNWSTPPNTGGTVTSVTVGTTIGAFELTQNETTPAPVISLAVNSGHTPTGKFLKDDGTWSAVPAGYTLNIDADSGGPGAVDAAGTIDVAGGTGITTVLTGSSSSRVITANLDNTAVAQGSYTNSSITVDAQGRLTSASSGASGGLATRTFIRATGDGSQQDFTGITVGANTLPVGTERNYIDVYIAGVYQSKTSYTFATALNGTVSFLFAPPVTVADGIEFVITS